MVSAPYSERMGGLVDRRPVIHLHAHGESGGFQIAGKVVPAVIAVDAHNIHRRNGDVTRVVVLAADERHWAVLRVKLMRQEVQRMPIVVGGLRIRIRVRLVAQAPQDDAGVILVAGNHVRQHLGVIIGGRPAIRVFAPFADADGGRFGNHDDTLAVAQGQHFLLNRDNGWCGRRWRAASGRG